MSDIDINTLEDEEEIEAVRAMREVEKKYNGKIAESTKQMRDEAIGSMDPHLEALRTSVGAYVPKLFWSYVNDSKYEYQDARIMVIGTFIRYRSMRHIIRVLPEEAKDRKMAELALKANYIKAQKAKERKKIKEVQEHQQQEKEGGKQKQTELLKIWIEPKSVYGKTLIYIISSEKQAACLLIKPDGTLADIKSKTEIDEIEEEERNMNISPAM